MPESSGRHLMHVIRRALRQPFSAAVLVLGGIWSLVTQNPLAFAGAIVAVLIYAFVKLQNESFIRAAIHEAQDARAREDRRNRTFRMEELDVDSRVRMKAIVKLQSEIREDIANSPIDEVAAGLAATAEESESIVDRGLAMAQKRCDMLRYLARTDAHSIEARIHSLQAKLSEETDAGQRADLESQIASRQQELEDYKAISESASGVLEQLDSIEIAFSALRARLVRIRSTDIADWVQANTELQTELTGLQTAVDSVEKSVEEVLSIRGAT